MGEPETNHLLQQLNWSSKRVIEDLLGFRPLQEQQEEVMKAKKTWSKYLLPGRALASPSIVILGGEQIIFWLVAARGKVMYIPLRDQRRRCLCRLQLSLRMVDGYRVVKL